MLLSLNPQLLLNNTLPSSSFKNFETNSVQRNSESATPTQIYENTVNQLIVSQAMSEGESGRSSVSQQSSNTTSNLATLPTSMLL